MLNHGGDETEGPLDGPAAATDAVRWDLAPPEASASGGWEMVLRATSDVQPQEQLLLSYGERPNDDFFLHYGARCRRPRLRQITGVGGIIIRSRGLVGGIIIWVSGMRGALLRPAASGGAAD